MGIFKLIDSGEDFILDDKSIIKNKKIKDKSYNPLTYAIFRNNFNALKTIVNFVKNNPDKDQISNLLLNTAALQHIYYPLIENPSAVKSIIETMPLKEKQQNLFLDIINTSLNYGTADYDYAIIKKHIPVRTINNYDGLKELNDSIHNFKEYAKDIVVLDFNTNLELLKDFISNYEKYHPYSVLYKKDSYREELKNVTDKTDDALLKINTFEELYAFIDTTMPDLINDSYKNSKNKSIFLGKTRSTEYLMEDVSLNKLNFYKKLHQNFKQENSLDDAFYFVLKNYLKDRREIDTTELNKLLEEKTFRSISVDKKAEIEKIVAAIREGSTQVESIFNIEPEDVGGTKLSLLFTFDESSEGGAAGLTPGGKLISYYLNSFKDLASRHFVHEFTHYLQDNKYYLNNLKYDEKGKNSLNNNEYWGSIDKSISDVRSDVEDVLDYSRTIFKQNIDKLEQEQVLLDIIKPHIDEPDNQKYRNTISDAISKILKAGYDYGYSFNNQHISSENFDKIIDGLVLIHKAHHSGDFLKNMWGDMDKINNIDYQLNPFEIHSRLTEKLTGIKGEDNLNDLSYPTDKMMTHIKPPLEKFNKMLATHYIDYIVPYKARSAKATYKSYFSDDEYFKNLNKKSDERIIKTFKPRINNDTNATTKKSI